MGKICLDLGFDIQWKTLIKPSTCVEMLGIIIDTNIMEFRISYERLNAMRMNCCCCQIK